MPIGKVWIYRSLFFVCLCVFVCVDTDFTVDDKASGVKFFSVVHRRPRQGITHFGELCSPRSPKIWRNGQRACHAHQDVNITVEMRRRKRHTRDAPFVKCRAACGRTYMIGIVWIEVSPHWRNCYTPPKISVWRRILALKSMNVMRFARKIEFFDFFIGLKLCLLCRHELG